MNIFRIFTYPFQVVAIIVRVIIDACPPYRYVEGLLEGKEVLQDEKTLVLYLSSEKIEVDRHTFDILMVGENLRVRATRDNKAINIDRLIPGQGPV